MTYPVDRSIIETYFSPMDRHFADFMVDLAGELPADRQKNLWLASALVSNFVGKGHICLNLSEIAGMPLMDDEDDSVPAIVCPENDEWIHDLQGLSVTGKPGDFTPLVLDEKNRLYLYRYWLYEQQLARSIQDMTQFRRYSVDRALLAEGLGRAFPDNDGTINWQCVAAILAVLNRFTVISGGPGTGKTYAVGRILTLLIDQAKGDDIGIALAAPTGKAAARLTDMVRRIKEELDCTPEAKRLIPEKALTIHRLLGHVYGAKTFRHNASNRLPFDVVVIDEASMIDLPLMAKLTTSLKENSRLIMLGDKDQLASVEPGAVFGDICATDRMNTFSAGFARAVGDIISRELPHDDTQGNALSDSIIVLQKSYRFGPDSGIGILASMVNGGKHSEALELLKDRGHNDIQWRDIPPPESLERILEDCYFSLYREYLTSRSPEEAFSLFNRFRLLCALRHGPYGVIAINRIIEHMCRRQGLIHGDGRWYSCQPVMVTSNDYQLKLFNGDVGILFPDVETDGELKVFFPSGGGGFRKLLPGRLKDFETVYAMTVHKSQGSEFDDVAIILPDRLSDVLTRELLYTAITRARKSVEIWGSSSVFSEALSRTTRRESGLKDGVNTNWQ
jgi:exodeoxyribonuclease V alpha subunit